MFAYFHSRPQNYGAGGGGGGGGAGYQQPSYNSGSYGQSQGGYQASGGYGGGGAGYGNVGQYDGSSYATTYQTGKHFIASVFISICRPLIIPFL